MWATWCVCTITGGVGVWAWVCVSTGSQEGWACWPMSLDLWPLNVTLPGAAEDSPSRTGETGGANPLAGRSSL